MPYANFIPTVWAEGINRDIEGLSVFAEDCNREYEGEVKNRGESVKILGVGKPTITTTTKASKNDLLADPETIEDVSAILHINQLSTFNYMVGDIDKAQSVGNIMDILSKETSEELASVQDKYIASFAADSSVARLFGATPKKVVCGTAGNGEENVLYVLDKAIEKLYENNVSPSTEIVVTLSPKFYTLFVREYMGKDTNNSGILKNGKVGMYRNVTVKMSTNVYKEGDVDHIMIRTKRALAFVNALTHTEAYRPEKAFADAVKGFRLFDAKVVRPKEMIDINVTY